MQYESAIYIRNACKSYGKKEILKDLCMTVKRGTIYGLLGASGCGKTTLLSCAVGRKSLNSGEVWVLGGQPGTEGSGVPGPRVGYMPQEIALVAEFTVKDAVYYFGRILDMEDALIEERFRKLAVILDLPPDDRYLRNCSGGQQRRVSFAAAMVHMPELLILDEPTVGVDPVLRDRIWNYLVEITEKEKMAVVITTHYIEEASQATTIGLMRGGKLLAEESPAALLRAFGTDSLEEVFLSLSRRQEEGNLDGFVVSSDNIVPVNSVQYHTSTDSLTTNGHDLGSKDILTEKKKKKMGPFGVSGKRMRALMDKNWKQFYRNISGVFFLMLFPVLEILAFLLAVGGDITDINVAIVNHEKQFDGCVNFSPNGTAVPDEYTDCHFKNLSCRFLTYLDHPMFHLIQEDSLESGLEGVKHGKYVGVLFMAENFTESLEERFNRGKDVDNETMSFSEIKTYMDMSNRQIGATIKSKLYELYLDFQKDVFRECNYLAKFSELPLHFNDPIYGNKDDSYTIFMIPGILLSILFFMGAVMTSQIIITDRCEGVWDRSAVAGVTAVEITLTHFALQACVVAVNVLEVFVIVFLVFQYKSVGSIGLIGLLTLLEGLCGMVFGFWISIVSYNHSMANIVTTGSFYPMILICGIIWPVEAMPVVLQWISKALPLTIAVQSVRNVFQKGWGIAHFEVINGIGMEILWIIGLGFISVFLIKSKR